MAGWTGLEPVTSCVTGRRSNQLNYHPMLSLDILKYSFLFVNIFYLYLIIKDNLFH